MDWIEAGNQKSSYVAQRPPSLGNRDTKSTSNIVLAAGIILTMKLPVKSPREDPKILKLVLEPRDTDGVLSSLELCHNFQDL